MSHSKVFVTAFATRLLVVLLLLPAAVQAQFTYTTNNGAIAITKLTCYGDTVAANIPLLINGLPVTSIGGFNCAALLSVTIPITVTNIDGYAFYLSSLHNITIPNSVISIGDGAFEGCYLTDVTIPASVTSLGVEVFGSCERLSTITVDPSNPAYSSVGGVLFDKNQNILIQYPMLFNLDNSYIIPPNVTSIEDYAFDNCTRLNGVTLPNSAISIGEWAFNYCTSLTSITIPNSVTSIGGYAFESCTSLTNVTIGSSVTSIGTNAFSNCSKLTSVTISNGVTSIGEGMFGGASMTSITIPASVTSIGDRAFAGCRKLTSIYFLGDAPSLGGLDVFAAYASPTIYYLPGAAGWGVTFGGRPTAAWQTSFVIVNVSANPSNGGTVSGSGIYTIGTNVQISANVNNGWTFTGWNDGNTQNPRTISVPFIGARYTANFSQQMATILVYASPSNGGTVNGGGSYAVGTNVQIYATANNGWIFTGWSDSNLQNPRPITVSLGGAAYTANFQQQTALIAVQASPSNGGTVSGGNTYNVGSSQQISATANNGWTFTGWSDGGAQAHNIIVPVGGATYTANFAQNSPETATIAVQASPANGGSVSGGGTYNVGASQQISATVNPGWTFVSWSDGGAQTHNITVPVGGGTYTATFTQNPTPMASIMVQVNLTNGGTVSGGGIYNVGSSQQITANANSGGWVFSGWSDGNKQNPRAITVPAGGATYMANFSWSSPLDYVKLTTESYQDKVACDAAKNCGTYPTGSFTINAILFTGAGINAANLNGNTPVAINIGNWSYHGVNKTLNDNPRYRAGATRATLPLTYQDSHGNTKSAGMVTIGFGKKITTLTITSKAGQDAQGDNIQGFIVADTLTNAVPGQSITVIGTSSATITIGNYSETLTNIVITGTAAAKNSKAKDSNTYLLDTVKIKGVSPR